MLYTLTSVFFAASHPRRGQLALLLMRSAAICSLSNSWARRRDRARCERDGILAPSGGNCAGGRRRRDRRRAYSTPQAQANSRRTVCDCSCPTLPTLSCCLPSIYSPGAVNLLPRNRPARCAGPYRRAADGELRRAVLASRAHLRRESAEPLRVRYAHAKRHAGRVRGGTG